MKTKIVYVLVSSPKDIYLEQAFVSMHSLRKHNSNAHIVLLTDRATEQTLKGVRKQEIKYVDELISIELDETKFNAQKRSRQLKTSVRNIIDGDYLFVDCDTIISRPLNNIDCVSAKIAACRDTHCLFNINPYRKMCLEHGHLLGWPIDSETNYFNSGVIYVKDCQESRDFYQRWNINLNKGYEKKVFMDQPSFAKTNYEMGHIVEQLPDYWNCQLKHGIRYLKDAYIVHYLCTNFSVSQTKQLFLLNEREAFEEIKKNGCITEEIERIIQDPFYGIAEMTECFAGDDVNFFHSESYKFLRSRFKKDELSLQDKWLLLIKRMGEFKNSILKRK